MSRPNQPTLDDILAEPTRLKDLPIPVILDLIEESKGLSAKASLATKAINTALENRYGMAAAGAYQAAGKDTGTVRVTDGDYEIVADRTKKVEWSQSALATIHAKITADGDPAEYIDVTYSVPERKYAAWPEHIRAVFEPARTLKPGSTSFKIVAKEAA